MSDLLLYGSPLRPAALGELLDHVFQANFSRQNQGGRGTPLCIWGSHGLGKTMIVEEYAAEHGWHLAYCAPAQFEEMGDLHGLPRHAIREDGSTVTEFAPPSWVPTEDGPGILLLDDVNRADDRILRGLMQLLQNFEMFSWKLPPRWQIVCTANPEGGDYSVTPMDDAMLTRMLHATLVFDVHAWAKWATRNDVDARGISFALTYPEVVLGRRTTPRSMTQFFEQIASIDDLHASRDLVHALATSSLDDVTVAAFMSFILDGLEMLVEPGEILDAEDFGPVSERIAQLARGEGDVKRVDRLSAMGTRLALTLTDPRYRSGPQHAANLVRFLLHDDLPNDLRMSLHRDLLSEGSEEVKAMMRDRELAERMLAEM